MLIGIACFYLALKSFKFPIHIKKENTPTPTKLSPYVDDDTTGEDIVKMEWEVSKTLKFNFNVPNYF